MVGNVYTDGPFRYKLSGRSQFLLSVDYLNNTGMEVTRRTHSFAFSSPLLSCSSCPFLPPYTPSCAFPPAPPPLSPLLVIFFTTFSLPSSLILFLFSLSSPSFPSLTFYSPFSSAFLVHVVFQFFLIIFQCHLLSFPFFGVLSNTILGSVWKVHRPWVRASSPILPYFIAVNVTFFSRKRILIQKMTNLQKKIIWRCPKLYHRAQTKLQKFWIQLYKDFQQGRCDINDLHFMHKNM